MFKKFSYRTALYRGNTFNLCIVGLATVFILSGCTSSEPAFRSEAALRVMASTTVFEDLVKQVGGERVGTATIVPSGVEVEDYNPKPAEIKRLSRADVVVLNGGALDGWALSMVKKAGKKELTVIELSQGLATLGGEVSLSGSAARDGNPHLWLDVAYAKIYVERIRDALAQRDPAGRELYQKNSADYLAQLDQLDRWIRTEVQKVPPQNRKLVTFHEAFPYFAKAYGFEVVGVVAPSPGQEPSAGELAALSRKVRAAQVKAVFSEAQFSPKVMEVLAKEAGVRSVVSNLYSDSLGDPPADSYIGMMRWNTQQVVEALR